MALEVFLSDGGLNVDLFQRNGDVGLITFHQELKLFTSRTTPGGYRHVTHRLCATCSGWAFLAFRQNIQVVRQQ